MIELIRQYLATLRKQNHDPGADAELDKDSSTPKPKSDGKGDKGGKVDKSDKSDKSDKGGKGGKSADKSKGTA